MRWIGVLLLVAPGFAGCVAEPTPANPGQGSNEGACPITYPDGSAFDCQATLLKSETLPTARPTVQQGWTCNVRSEDDEGAGAMSRFDHQDRRMGVYWDWKKAPKGGVALITIEVYTAKGHQALLTPFTAKGFKAFPSPPPDTKGDIYSLVREFRLDVNEEGTWETPANASLLVGQFQGQLWYVWRFEAANRTHFVDLMVHRPTQSEVRQYRAEKQLIQRDGLEIFAEIRDAGFKSIGRDFAPSPAGPAACEINEAV